MGIGQQQEKTKKKEVTKQDRDRLIDAYEKDEDLNAVITVLSLKKIQLTESWSDILKQAKGTQEKEVVEQSHR